VSLIARASLALSSFFEAAFPGSAVHSFAGSSCERRGRRAERLSAFSLVPVQKQVGVISARGAPRALRSTPDW
jgi:hypothetical protein